MRAAIYARVSTTKRGQEHGLEAQRRACLQFIQQRGLANGEPLVFVDQISGRRSERPGLNRLIQQAAMKQVRSVVVFKLDRLSRGGILEMCDVLNKLRKYGVKVYAVADGFWNPDIPDEVQHLMMACFAYAAKMESDAISERVAAGIAARRAEATEAGERFLWGRARVSKLTKDPDLPAKAGELRLQGRSWSQIAQALGVGRTTARRLYHLCQIALAETGGSSNGG